jgi:CcmD family protein
MITPLVRRFVRVAAVLMLAGGLLPAAVEAAQPQTPPAAQSEYLPIDELEPQEQLPAAPLVIAAYSIAWLATFIYLWSIWRRLQKVDRELAEVSRRVSARVRS